jgi:hypothetical protein
VNIEQRFGFGALEAGPKGLISMRVARSRHRHGCRNEVTGGFPPVAARLYD